MIISIGPQEIFAEKEDEKKKKEKEDEKKKKEKEDEKKKKEKEDEKKKKEKEDEKKKKEKEDEKKNEQSPAPSENVDDEPSPAPSENVDDEQNLISHTKRSANDNALFFGTDSFGNRYIDTGFTFNDFITDVEDFKTHMPLQTIQVGESNTAVLKIYNHKGISTLEHVELVFGLEQKQSDGLNTNAIVWEQNFKGTQSVSTKDPDNLLMDVNAVGEADDKVMSITFIFAFREPMEK